MIVSTAALQLFNLTSDNAIGKTATFSLFMPKKNENGEISDELEVVDVKKEFQIVGVIDDPASSYVFAPLGSVENLDIPFYSQLKVKVKEQKVLGTVKD